MLYVKPKHLLLTCSIVASTALAGCAAKHEAGPTIGAAATPTMMQDENIHKTYGIWQIDGCELSATRAGVTLKTDGYTSTPSLGTYRFVLTTPTVPVYAPKVSLMGIDYALPAPTGRGRSWAFSVPADAQTFSHMINDDVFIQVAYLPQPTRLNPVQVPLKYIFSAAKLPDALVQLDKSCHHPAPAQN